MGNDEAKLSAFCFYGLPLKVLFRFVLNHRTYVHPETTFINFIHKLYDTSRTELGNDQDDNCVCVACDITMCSDMTAD